MRYAYMTPLLVALTLFASVPTSVHAQALDPVGTWTLNVAKSSFPNGTAPRSETRVYQPVGVDGLRGIFTRVEASGARRVVSYETRFDGTPRRIYNSPNGDTIALMRLDANRIASTTRRRGVVTMRSVSTLTTTPSSDSGDSSTRVVPPNVYTVVTTAVDSAYRTTVTVAVFERTS